jgi:hypothetical protein
MRRTPGGGHRAPIPIASDIAQTTMSSAARLHVLVLGSGNLTWVSELRSRSEPCCSTLGLRSITGSTISALVRFRLNSSDNYSALALCSRLPTISLSPCVSPLGASVVVTSEASPWGELGLPIDRASVEVYVEQSPRTERWTNSADKAGFNLDKAPWSDDLDEDMSDGIADLTQASQRVGFTDLAQLDAFLEQAEAWGEAALVAMRTGGRDGEWYVSPAFILASLVYIGSGISADDLETQSGGAKFYINSILRARDVVPSEPRASDVADQSRPQHR